MLVFWPFLTAAPKLLCEGCDFVALDGHFRTDSAYLFLFLFYVPTALGACLRYRSFLGGCESTVGSCYANLVETGTNGTFSEFAPRMWPFSSEP